MRTLARRPTRRLVRAVAVLVMLGFAIEAGAMAAGAPPRLGPLDARVLWWAALLVGAVVAAVDFVRIRALPAPRVARSLPGSLALHDWATIRVAVAASDRLRGASLVDAPPRDAHTTGLPAPLPDPAPGGERFELTYRLRPNRRGTARFGAMQLCAVSPAGLWRFTAPCGEPASVRVLPNFSTVARFDALAAEDDAARAGIVRRQRRGEGTEFHQLRDYRPGDPVRRIDWKATSRRRTLITREYEDERDQRVVFLLDSSRRMRAKEGDLSHFDHALDAMILLAHVALRGGDSVGFLSFGEAPRWLPPGKGVARVDRLLETVYDLEPTTVGADFRQAAQELGRRQTRRALVVLLTTLRGEDEADLVTGLHALRRRHLVLVVNLRPEGLDAALQRRVDDFPAALRFVGAAGHERERGRLADALERQGAMILDVSPARLTPRLVSRYFAIKRSGAL